MKPKLLSPLTRTLLGGICVWSTLHAEIPPLTSGPQRVSLLELYTSEGCSSCPPAEAWLAQWKARPELWSKLVPVAFHVTYWDSLGWSDNWARPEFTERQHQLARRNAAGSVYTPGFFLNGREWSGWFRGGSLPLGSQEKTGRLTVLVSTEQTNLVVRPQWKPEPGHEGPVTWRVALLGFDLKSHVERGENQGRQLEHQFTALALSSSEAVEPKFMYPSSPGTKAVVAWVEEINTGDILQAAGGFLVP